MYEDPYFAGVVRKPFESEPLYFEDAEGSKLFEIVLGDQAAPTPVEIVKELFEDEDGGRETMVCAPNRNYKVDRAKGGFQTELPPAPFVRKATAAAARELFAESGEWR